MSVSHRYRNFGGGSKPEQPKSELNTDEIEDQKLQSFEAGYQAGWDDATKAQEDDKTRIGAELGQNLQDMTFTYHEALSKLTGSFEPVLNQIIEKLLPDLQKASLGAHILEQVTSLVKDAAGQSIEIVVAPSNVEKVQELAGTALATPFEIVGEASLGEGQAFVRIGTSERQIDLDSVLAGVAQAMTAFFHEAKQENSNG